MSDEELPTEGEVTRQQPYTELGTTGLTRFGGYVSEEFLPQLRGQKAVKVFREMSDNDPVVGAIVFAVKMLLREVRWRVEAASDGPEDQQAAEFVETCMADMEHTWEDFIDEVLSMLVYGWSWFEVVYKRRIGDVKNPRFRSKHQDGLIGWRKLPIRAQETLHEWDFADDGSIRAMTQIAPPDYGINRIPMNKSMLFRTAAHKNNPEGRSILRNAYRPWYFKKRMEEVEGIGIERDLAGLPVARIPAKYLHPNASEDERKLADQFKKMVRNVRRDEQEGVVMPRDYDDDGNELYEFELMSSGGSRQIDINEAITRYEQRMAMTILADFILLGHDKVGSYALSVDKTGIFRTSLNAWAKAVSEVLNRHEIPRLFDLNGWRLPEYPQINPGNVDAPDLAELGDFIQKLTGAGWQLFPDTNLDDFLRESARMPERSPELDQAQAAQAGQQMAQQAQQAQGMVPPMDEFGSEGLDPNEMSPNGQG